MIDGLEVDWDSLLSGQPWPSDPSAVGSLISDACAQAYSRSLADSCLLEFEQHGASYLFDQATAIGAAQADRTVAAWTVTPDQVAGRDIAYQRGFPLADLDDSIPRDRGHLVPHLSGGAFGPNIFPQDRALNRGWSDEGKRYRAIERHAAEHPGSLFFGRLIYFDDTDYPGWVEIGVLTVHRLRWARFANRPQPGSSGTA